ncbi:MAG: energy transducer TonB, partial [Alkalispirochaeta sp.]
TEIDFTVPAPEEVEPPDPPEREREMSRSRDRAPVAPAPSLGGNLSGIAVDVPGFEVEGLSDVRESLLGDLDDVALTEDAVDTKPIPQSRPLEYPDRARQRRIEGRVVVSALIDADGNVRDVKILEADPPNVFDEAVLNSVPNWTFEPAKYRGEPVQTWAQIPIPFRLN